MKTQPSAWRAIDAQTGIQAIVEEGLVEALRMGGITVLPVYDAPLDELARALLIEARELLDKPVVPHDAASSLCERISALVD